MFSFRLQKVLSAFMLCMRVCTCHIYQTKLTYKDSSFFIFHLYDPPLWKSSWRKERLWRTERTPSKLFCSTSIPCLTWFRCSWRLNKTPRHINPTPFIHSSAGGHLGWLHALASVHRATIIREARVPPPCAAYCSPGLHSGVAWLRHAVGLSLVL